MRKVSFLLALFGLMFLGARAQTYYQVTAVPTGFGPTTQTVGGVTAKISKVYGNGFCGPLSGTFCGVSPYEIGVSNPGGFVCRNGYRYDFTPGVTDIRIHMASLNDSDTIKISIPNGFTSRQIPLSAANTKVWSSSCSPTTTNVGFTSDGRITGLGRPSGFNDVEIDIQNPFSPYLFDSIQITSTSRARTGASDGVVYDLFFAYDTCNLHFNVYADTPICSGRDLKLHASDFPNTTHHWYNLVNTWTVTGTGTANANPVYANNPPLQPVNPTISGFYIDSAVRGVCTYRDTFNVNVDITPNKPTFTQPRPKCPGEDDSLFASSNLSAGGTYSFYGSPPSGSFGPITYINGQNYYIIKNVQVADAGSYSVYAQSPQGCVSDTTTIGVLVNAPAVAAFSVNQHLGCNGDTMFLNNFSSSTANIFNWDFDDGTTATTFTRDTNHIYHVPSSAMPATFHIKLTVGNGNCSDDTTVNIVINHPLAAAFSVDVDTICQGALVTFTNNSIYPPATIPNYVWYFMDGDTSTDVLGTTHTYNKEGVFNSTLVVRDYLGCHDTATHTIVVDSVGSISFDPSDTNLCLGKYIDFYGTYSPLGINSATWDFNDGSDPILNVTHVRHAYTLPGTYTISFAADYRICPDVTYTKILTIKPFPVVDLGPDTTICPAGKPLALRDIINDGNPDYTWRWNTPTKDSTSAIYVYHPGTYSVTATLNGCSTTDSITVFKKCYLDIPNVFTPNGDGSNDYFLPRELLSRGVSTFKMTIVNRWGGKVFETSSINGRGWDGYFNGEAQPVGVYVYMIDVNFVNGETEHYEGNVTLLR